MSGRIFLVGGGRDPAGVAVSHRPFVDAADGGEILLVVLDEGEETDVVRWTSALEAAGATAVRPLVVTAERPPAADDLDGAAGVYVAGGHTPSYREVLGADPGFAAALRDGAAPYAGFSAGAAVAPARALVGGWLDGELPVCADEAGEDLDQLTLGPGLGLLDVLVDVHCAQWGTLTRLAAAVSREGRPGWGVDEHTALELTREGEAVAIHGLGAAYAVRPGGDGVIVRRHRPSATSS